jgi:hypothetical protein
MSDRVTPFGKLRTGISLLAALAAMAAVWATTALPASAQTVVCDRYCDGRNPSLAKVNRIGPSTVFDGRRVVLHFDDADDMAWASIGGGTPGDQVWMDRSWDGGYTWSTGSKLGDTSIPSGRASWRTEMYNVDQWSSTDPLNGVVRACGQTGNVISCTPWARTTWNAADNRRAAATALMDFYNLNTGLFNGTGWWNSANDLTAIIDNIRVTGMGSYEYAIARTYELNLGKYDGEFRDSFMDDTGWWAMTWLDAYDLTGNKAYLVTAEDDANWMAAHWTSACGGGILWEVGKPYKASIANELYLYVNAALHNRIPGDHTYLERAQAEWNWFSHSGLINGSNLVVDGLNSTGCGKSTAIWSYNQGVILEGLTELYKATGQSSVLAEAEKLATASTTAPALNAVSSTAPQGELQDPSSGGGDEPTFKGAYIRGLTELNDQVGLYGCYLDRQSAVAYLHDRDDADQYGNLWAGPWSSTPQSGPDRPSAAQQGSAVFLEDGGLSYTSPLSPAVNKALHC